MALFTDANVISLTDLLPFESTLAQVASSHAINVDTKINLAVSSIGEELMLWMLNVGASDPQFLTRRLIGLSTVVITAPVQQWICMESLSRFFAEAYNVQLNTRFQGKWTEYQTASQHAAEMVFMSGLGIVYKPLPQPSMPVASVQTGSVNLGSLFIQTAWVDSHGNESALSPINGLILNGSVSVTIQMAEGANSPSNAIGWNIYANSSSDGLTRQNVQPIGIGSVWQLPDSGLVSGSQATNGQQPDFYIALSRQLLRG